MSVAVHVHCRSIDFAESLWPRHASSLKQNPDSDYNIRKIGYMLNFDINGTQFPHKITCKGIAISHVQLLKGKWQNEPWRWILFCDVVPFHTSLATINSTDAQSPWPMILYTAISALAVLMWLIRTQAEGRFNEGRFKIWPTSATWLQTLIRIIHHQEN